MPFDETSQSKPMSDFSLPYLKDIPRKDKRDIMADRWHEAEMDEVYKALDDADDRWDRCIEMFAGALMNKDEIRHSAMDWGYIVTTVILSFYNDTADIAEVRGIDVASIRETTRLKAELLSQWCDAIRNGKTIDRIIQLARQGITFLEKEQFSPKEARFEYKFAIAKAVRKHKEQH